MSGTEEPTRPQRVVVFIDDANVYNDARRCFHDQAAPSTAGRVWPMRFARELVHREPLGTADDRDLKEVRVYTGMPNSTKQSQNYAAARRHIAAWRNAGATVIARPLRYPNDWPNGSPEQKGVDVQIAIDMVLMAIQDELDVAILASTDTDLKPALEAFFILSFGRAKRVEVAAWRKGGFAKRLSVSGEHVWCHYLDEATYQSLRDYRDYNLP